jgi:hypothetical protein
MSEVTFTLCRHERPAKPETLRAIAEVVRLATNQFGRMTPAQIKRHMRRSERSRPARKGVRKTS